MAPAMMINDEVIAQVNPQKLNGILEKCDWRKS
jgi:NADH:ubiquinone oxidoreductase subunit E